MYVRQVAGEDQRPAGHPRGEKASISDPYGVLNHFIFGAARGFRSGLRFRFMGGLSLTNTTDPGPCWPAAHLCIIAVKKVFPW